jgi:hypothetical protein
MDASGSEINIFGMIFIGLVALPCYLGDPEPELTRRLPSLPAELATELWILTDAGLKNTGRVHAFIDLVGDRLA